MIKLAENIISWCNNPEEGAIKQAQNIANHPCLFGNVCLMPDTHEGYGMPIGGVVALDNAICPNMVGVDIGCGMLCVSTSLKVEDLDRDKLTQIMKLIRRDIPLGFAHQKNPVEHEVFDVSSWDPNFTPICNSEFDSARKQIGTLGGGNHFIEIQKDAQGDVYFMIHSGSRNLGYKVAKYYNEKAKELCTLWRHDDVVQADLAFLPTGTIEAIDYINEMQLCLSFAYANRQVMANAIKNAFREVFPDVKFISEVNIHHNYASLENHWGKNVWVHRKGATLARENTTGIIPGSQGTASYIVQGKSNPASFCSCSHGAGRKMSRKKAQENLNLQEEQRKMDEQGILHSIRGTSDLDEAAGAYKDIDIVMEEQADLVDVIVKLYPLAVIKG